MDIELGIVACPSEDCTLGVDVALLSSDGVTHGAHSKNLELYSEGFPPASLAAAVHKLPGDLEIVQVTETSNVIALLLQYVHNQPQPDSTAFSFETLAGLAEAAEKYLVYPAIEVCKIRMEASIPGHPLEVFAYATRHGYPKLRDAAAPLTIGCPLAAVVTVLGDRPDVFVAWVTYREGFVQALHSLFKRPPIIVHRGGIQTCESWAVFEQNVLDHYGWGDRLSHIQAFPSYVDAALPYLDRCKHCLIRARSWRETIAAQLNNLSPLRSFL